ncbi:MAG: FAD-dependent oxidoreductase [Promethearchaeia archaeon]
MSKIKIGIIGAGSAGIFAANELGKSNHDDLEITMFDAGPDIENRMCPHQELEIECKKCDPCRIMSGVGGAGCYSSGILNLNKKIGGDIEDLCERVGLNAEELIASIDDFFVKNGAPEQYFDPYQNKEKLRALRKKCAAADIKFIPIKQRVLGSKNTPKVLINIRDYLTSHHNINIIPNTMVMSFNEQKKVVLESGKEKSFDYLLVAPGRWGMVWLAEECERVGIETQYMPLDIGVRVEVPAIIMEDICEDIQRDPKFHIITPTYNDFVRTFCVNHKGSVVREHYDKNIVGVNGHQLTVEGNSDNSNFAFLIRQKLTSPLEDTTEYGRSISKQTSILGGYKPLLQTLGDLRSGHRSRTSLIDRNPVQPTLKENTPGDIAMAYPYRFVCDILEGLAVLDKVIPGVNNDSTLIYAPEFKRSAKRVETNEFLEAKQIEDIFFAGDGAGLSRGIVGAAVTGIIAAKGILEKV